MDGFTLKLNLSVLFTVRYSDNNICHQRHRCVFLCAFSLSTW